MYGWYIRPNPSLSVGGTAASSGMTYTTSADPYR